jgi:arginine utilization protein RocB
MALIRGFRGLCPCPICLVPHKDQRRLTEQYPLRTVESTKAIIELVKSKRTAVEREEILKENGLRAISVSSTLNKKNSTTIQSY